MHPVYILHIIKLSHPLSQGKNLILFLLSINNFKKQFNATTTIIYTMLELAKYFIFFFVFQYQKNLSSKENFQTRRRRDNDFFLYLGDDYNLTVSWFYCRKKFYRFSFANENRFFYEKYQTCVVTADIGCLKRYNNVRYTLELRSTLYVVVFFYQTALHMLLFSLISDSRKC